MWTARQDARLQLRKQILRERGAIPIEGSKYNELPSWVRMPDAERIEWVNQVMLSHFSYCNPILTDPPTAMAVHQRVFS
jgi:hypothetical protein